MRDGGGGRRKETRSQEEPVHDTSLRRSTQTAHATTKYRHVSPYTHASPKPLQQRARGTYRPVRGEAGITQLGARRYDNVQGHSTQGMSPRSTTHARHYFIRHRQAKHEVQKNDQHNSTHNSPRASESEHDLKGTSTAAIAPRTNARARPREKNCMLTVLC